MPLIQLLPEHLIAKIAAGEVIERPAFAVKELLENALDAQATLIQVDIEEGGLKRICVCDNGHGMSPEDVELSYLPHTTSKLRDDHELVGIKTMGFRGEALSSIAAIAKLSIKSRLQEQPGGTEVVIRYGQKERIAPVGCPPGTNVTIDNLFLNVPARKKFLKSEKTEFRLISDVVLHYALSYPTVHFILTHNKKIILDLPSRQNDTDRVQTLLGRDLFDHLLPISYEEGVIRIDGYIGKPQVASRQQQKQYLFINKRHVTDRLISQAAKDAFGTLLPSSNTPVFLLNLSLPHEMVDVNVHPRKETVAFINNEAIYSAVKQAVAGALNEHNLTFRMAKFKQETSAKLGETTSFAGTLLKEHVLPWHRSTDGTFDQAATLIQIHQTYIFNQTKDGFLLFDQHAAHERILFEKFSESFISQQREKLKSPLSTPITLHLQLSDSQLLDEHLQVFEELGFSIDHFQGTTYVIRAVPIIFKGRNVAKIISDILTDKSLDIARDIDTRSQRMLAFLACRAAVKAGDLLTDKQMKDIVQTLSTTPNNTTCPHGRPTRVDIGLTEIHKLFKR